MQPVADVAVFIVDTLPAIIPPPPIAVFKNAVPPTQRPVFLAVPDKPPLYRDAALTFLDSVSKNLPPDLAKTKRRLF